MPICGQKISESVLDDLPGIGGSRGAALLKRLDWCIGCARQRWMKFSRCPSVKSATALKAFLETRPKSSK